MEKTNDERLIETMERCKELEERYSKMTKEELISYLVFKEMMAEAVDPEKHKVSLWCFVGDDTNAMYLTEREPKEVMVYSPGELKLYEDGVVPSTVHFDKLYFTEGEVNIRVPKVLEELFPVMTFGDTPQRIQLTISF